jgi:coiled-coil domain-containing protein 12
LKRKQPDQDSEAQTTPAKDEEVSVTNTYLSGRNYDAETRGPKLGFETAPDAQKDTLEVRAAALELNHKSEVAKAEEEKDAPIDLFRLQPKKPNWDLKRDFKERTAVLDVRTKNAVARLVRERLEGEKAKKIANGEKNGDEEVVPMKGGELLEAVHMKERQEEEERRREREEDEAEIT